MKTVEQGQITTIIPSRENTSSTDKRSVWIETTYGSVTCWNLFDQELGPKP